MTTILQFHQECSFLAGGPLYLVGLSMIILGFLIAFIQNIPFDKELSVRSISYTWRQPGGRLSALLMILIITIIYPCICIANEGLRAIFIVGLVLILIVVCVNPEYIKNAKTPAEKLQNLQTYVHSYSAATVFTLGIAAAAVLQAMELEANRQNTIICVMLYCSYVLLFGIYSYVKIRYGGIDAEECNAWRPVVSLFEILLYLLFAVVLIFVVNAQFVS